MFVHRCMYVMISTIRVRIDILLPIYNHHKLLVTYLSMHTLGELYRTLCSLSFSFVKQNGTKLMNTRKN